jgi:CDP-4-dehydro-6-deoxyglucose reductase
MSSTDKTTMTEVRYEGGRYAVAPDETVLDALLRGGVNAAHSCKAGTCGSCMLRAVAGTIPAAAQAGLKDSWKAQGYFLPCVCRPESDLTVTSVGSDAQVQATIAGIEMLSRDVIRVRLHSDEPLEFRAGQYITLLRGDGVARSYSIASLPDEGEIELHVRSIANGKMSGWLHHEARPGDRLTVLGPGGDCFYVPGKPEQPLLLVGTGTGLAPLYGILRDALQQGHRGPIHLFHGALHGSGLYLADELRKMAADHGQLEYVPAVLNGEASDGFAIGAIDNVVLGRLPNLKSWRGYVCGDPALVRLLKKKLFLAGMASREIHADAFLPSA